MCSSLQLEEFYEYEKVWYDKIYVPFICKHKERFFNLIDEFEIKSWDEWYGAIISKHPNITMDFINQHPELGFY